MAGIAGKNTKPEMVLRRGLHRLGLRFRLNDARLPGRPDLVFPKHRAVLFAHGCFWHRHECHLFKWPQSRIAFWREKIESNRERDLLTLKALEAAGWRVGVVWECAMKGRTKLPLAEVFEKCEIWLRSDVPILEVKGVEARPPV